MRKNSKWSDLWKNYRRLNTMILMYLPAWIHLKWISTLSHHLFHPNPKMSRVLVKSRWRRKRRSWKIKRKNIKRSTTKVSSQTYQNWKQSKVRLKSTWRGREAENEKKKRESILLTNCSEIGKKIWMNDFCKRYYEIIMIRINE